MLLDKIKVKNKKLSPKEDLIAEITEHLPEVLVTLGAGDIDRLVEPLKNALLNKIA